MTADWTDADYGREDGRANALAGCEPFVAVEESDEYEDAYRQSYDATLAELYPDNIRPVTS